MNNRHCIRPIATRRTIHNFESWRLHLITAHHGHARPHFSHSFDKDFSLQECEATHLNTIRLNTIRRFAELQRRYGRWGLAYLESLLRAADAAASAGLETDDELDDQNGGDE